MVYNSGTGEYKGFILKEEVFDAEMPQKTESIMCLGNGYMGVRSANEDYVKEDSRATYVAGTFNWRVHDESAELPNIPDVVKMTFNVGDETVSVDGNMANYEKTLNLKNGLLRRYYEWTSKNGKRLQLEFLRVVSLKDFHLICSKVNIKALDDCEIDFESGISNDIMCNDHFEPVGMNAINDVLQVTGITTVSRIPVSVMTCHRYEINGVKIEPDFRVSSDADLQISASLSFALKAGNTLTITKVSNVFTGRDKERDGCDMATLVADASAHMASVKGRTLEDILEESAAEWDRRVWSVRDVKVDCDKEEFQLAVRFALYHLTIMAPVHDNRMNIGAKGLSGPGYRGHTFWDTEIFMLPYFIFTCPKEARSLIEYRYRSIGAARENAKKKGYEGAMFPWEAAWIEDGEMTPDKYKTGLQEHHITADVAVGVYYYYIATGDEDFMENYGYELLFDTAKFWSSRLEYNAEKDIYEILCVIGPDEYKEDIDNNAYTNYLAQYNLQLAIHYYEKLKADRPEVYERLNAVLGLDKAYETWCDRVDKIYLPRENEDGLVPQDDTYLSLIDISREGYNFSEHPHEVHDQVWKLGGLPKVMISKQADVMQLMYMFEDLFSAEVKKKNFYFYERRCIHDSSLSLSTYSALAADLGEKETAITLFGRAAMIDMGPVMWSSHAGIHAASLGGIWQCIVLGFGGVRRYGENLRIEPNLPDNWNEVSTNIVWKGQTLALTVKQDGFTVKNLTGTKDISILHKGELIPVGETLEIKY